MNISSWGCEDICVEKGGYEIEMNTTYDIGSLSASIKNIVSTDRVKESSSTDFFAELGDGWKDELTTDEVMSRLYAARASNKTRPNIKL